MFDDSRQLRSELDSVEERCQQTIELAAFHHEEVVVQSTQAPSTSRYE